MQLKKKIDKINAKQKINGTISSIINEHAAKVSGLVLRKELLRKIDVQTRVIKRNIKMYKKEKINFP